MEVVPKADPSLTHFEVLGLDESATLVRRQIEEAYEKRAQPCLEQVGKLDAASPEAADLRARLSQLAAARAVLVPRRQRDEYKQQLQKLRDAERDLERETGRHADEGKEGSAVLILHLRQQVERSREELRKLHERQARQHAFGQEGGEGAEAEEEEAETGPGERRRRTARFGERAAALAALAARRPVKRY